MIFRVMAMRSPQTGGGFTAERRTLSLRSQRPLRFNVSGTELPTRPDPAAGHAGLHRLTRAPPQRLRRPQLPQQFVARCRGIRWITLRQRLAELDALDSLLKRHAAALEIIIGGSRTEDDIDRPGVGNGDHRFVLGRKGLRR